MADDAVASWLEENGHSGSFFFFKQKTAYEIIAGDWSSDVCSSDLAATLTSRRSSGSQAFRRGADTASCKSPGAVSAARSEERRVGKECRL